MLSLVEKNIYIHNTMKSKIDEYMNRSEEIKKYLDKSMLFHSFVGLERVYGKLLWPLPGWDKSLF